MKEKKYSILLVDDDKFLLDMYSTKFTEQKFDVTAVFGAAEAISKIEEGLAPDIILTDIVMPVTDGFEFLASLQEKKLAKNACVIVLSNLGQQEDLDKAKSLGADGYIVKATSTPSEVVQRVLEIVEEKK
ncbi:MAG: response regulator [Candidatus Paceibacterota bacterium]|jgi:CheY-like chemotaxis protein|nr:response regulator [Candidatus Paceibacterota bacterium]